MSQLLISVDCMVLSIRFLANIILHPFLFTGKKEELHKLMLLEKVG